MSIFEDLNLNGMKALWGRKVSDLGFGDFLKKQEWLCSKYGRGFVKIPRFEPTTKLMGCCGHIQSVELSEREVTCKNCGTIHDRDINAARNIKELGRRLWLEADSKTSSEAVCV
jgi:putative transposase